VKQLFVGSVSPLLAFSPLFLGSYWLFADHGAAPDRIVIDRGQVATIRAEFRATWHRNPTQEELLGLVEPIVRREILDREADALGLPRGDPNAEARVRQKYEALADARLAARAPTEAELAGWLAVHAADYARPATVSYSQLLLVAAGTPGDAVDAARRARNRLDRGVRRTRIGIKTELPARVNHIVLDEVAREYGDGFADVLAHLPVGIWLGPVESRYGAHLVRLESIEPGATPPLDEVRAQVTRDYEADRRQRTLATVLREMRWRYEVEVEPPLARQASR
jgi:hypothetical protein